MNRESPELPMKDPGAGRGHDGPEIRSMVSTEVLDRRPSRPPDYAAENKAIVALAQSMAVAPEGICKALQRRR